MIHNIAINIRPDDIGSLLLVKEIIEFLQKKKIRSLLPRYDAIIDDEVLSSFAVSHDDFVMQPDLIIVIGGDGSFLRTARLFSHRRIPIFGINKGRLGFLTEFTPEEAVPFLSKVISGDYATSERAMLQAVAYRDGDEIARLIFLNDAVISKGSLSRPISLYLEIDGMYLNSYSGDGLIISTATGSTAYSLSAGGPIISPAIDCVYTINPVCPHMLAIRPMIVPITSVLRARILSDFENLLLTIDGQEGIRIQRGDEVVFSRSDASVTVITHPRHNYYEILRQKLGWGKI